MFNHDLWVQTLGLIVVGAPALLVAAIGLPALIDRPLGERAIGRWAYGTIVVSLLSSLVILGIIVVSLIPIGIEFIIAMREKKNEKQQANVGATSAAGVSTLSEGRKSDAA